MVQDSLAEADVAKLLMLVLDSNVVSSELLSAIANWSLDGNQSGRIDAQQTQPIGALLADSSARKKLDYFELANDGVVREKLHKDAPATH